MDMIRVMGLWKQKDKNGHTFLSGNLNPISSVMVMPNTYKKDGSKEPDYFLYFKQNEKKEDKGEDKKNTLF